MTADRQPRATGFYARTCKRIFDIAFVVLAAPVAVPLIILFAVAARMDGGPAFYAQDRVGRFGKVFKCWKIRTMVPNADALLEEFLAKNPGAREEWDRTQKLQHDPRVTAFGAFLRSTSLDELPQIWNILVGDMTLVGPRPFTPNQTELYPGDCYFGLRPGLTGPWQVGDRNDCSFATRAVHDARYARELSFVGDLAILLRTAEVVVRRTGC